MSNQVSSWLNAVTAIALAIAVGVIVKDRTGVVSGAAAAVTDESQQSRLERLERELAALSAQRTGEPRQTDVEARLESLEGEMAELSAQVNSTVDPTGAAISADPIEQERPENEPDQQMLTALENSLASEPRDANGSMAAAAELLSLVQYLAFENTQVSEVQCQSTLCRISVSHADPEAEMLFTQSLTATAAFSDSESIVHHLPSSDGGVDTVVYASRAGHHLPVSPRS